MLFVFYGTDVEAVRAKSDALIAGLLRKRPDAARAVVTETSFNAAELAELGERQSLFGGSYIVEIVRVGTVPGALAALAEYGEALAQSHNVVIVREGELPEQFLAAIAPHAQKIVRTDVRAPRPASRRFNPFSLGDALLARDRKGLFIALAEGRLSGVADEEMVAALWFAAKTLRAASLAPSADDAGLKSYPFQKAKAALQRSYTDAQTQELLDSLFTLQTQWKSGEGDLAHLLERWVLAI